MSRDRSSADAAEDGAADAVKDATPDTHSKESGDRSGSGDESPAHPGGGENDSDCVGRPLVAGAIGLLAGVGGGTAATTIAPGNLFLTILLIVVVVLVVTLGTLRVLAG